MSKRPRFRLVLLALSLACTLYAAAEDAQKQKLDRQYQSAVADYDAGQYAAAADQLEKLLPYAPKSYEIHELLGWCMPRFPRTTRPSIISRPQSS